MRILHTSDWHLGRSFHGVGLLGAQAAYLDHLVELVRNQGVRAVLVAGDVYDRALPAPDTVSLLSETLVRLVDAGAQVVISSGNHDSAIRLGFASPLLERSGLHLRTRVEDIGRPVVIGDCAVHALPYLEPTLTAGALGTEERTHAGVLRAAMARVRPGLGRSGHDVVMAHAFVSGGVGSDSERDISVGGVSAVSPEVFDGASYVALGHLHGQQQVEANVRYSGSPVAMSFGEAGQRKGSLLLDVTTGGVTAELLEAPVPRPLAVLRGDLEDLLTDPRHAAAEHAWCQITLTDGIRPQGAMDRLRRRFPHTLELRFEPQGVAIPTRSYTERVHARSDVDVCCDFLEHVRGGASATDDERELFQQALEESRVHRQELDDRGRTAAGLAGRAAGAA